MSILFVDDGGPSRTTTFDLLRKPPKKQPAPKQKMPAKNPITVFDRIYAAPPPKVQAPRAPAPSRSSGDSAAKAAAAAEARARAERAAAEARAIKAANNAARLQALQDIERINAEITANQARRTTNLKSLDALKALVGDGPGSHASVRDNALRTIDEALKTKMAQIQETYDLGMGNFYSDLRDNEATEADASFANLANRAREKHDLVTQALAQGAGESDVLRSQLQSLRNWGENQEGINRAFFDTRASINVGISDLGTNTRTGMINEELSANSARAQRWDDYFDALSNTYAEMANLDQNNYLLQAEIDAAERAKGVSQGLLDWLGKGKNAADYEPPTPKSTKALAAPKYESEYARKSAEAAGSLWEDPGVSQSTLDWQAAGPSEGGLNTTQLWNAQDNTNIAAPSRRPKRPEGATLRRW